VGQHSKPVVHFVIQAPNWEQMCLRTFSDIGPLEILSYVRHIGFQNGCFTLHGRFTITFVIIFGSNVAIDLILMVVVNDSGTWAAHRELEGHIPHFLHHRGQGYVNS